mmetsp:Transcript_25696/g.59247  ORF Transcript_25696/g.59247 Transcript_25696/m.59247 type:complete len:262 (-) Transcript_25696:16-801(-)
MGSGAEGCLIFSLFCITALALSFIALKIDGVLDWTWWGVMAPLLLLSLMLLPLILIFFFCILVYSNNSDLPVRLFWFGLAAFLYCIFAFTVTAKLADPDWSNWYWVFSPLFCGTFLFTAVDPLAFPDFKHKWHSRHANLDNVPVKVLFKPVCILLLVFFVLLAMRLEEDVVWDWAYVFSPLWLTNLFCILVIFAMLQLSFRAMDPAVLLVFLLLFSCLGVFEVLVYLKVSGLRDYAARVCFVPLFGLVCFFGILVCVVLTN